MVAVETLYECAPKNSLFGRRTPSTFSVCNNIRQDRVLMARVPSTAGFIVALHIGSEWSSFAYAHKLSPDCVYVFNDWPRSVREIRFSKTLSAVYYEPGDTATAKVKSWGNTACTDYERAIDLAKQRPSEMSEVGTFFKYFKESRELSIAMFGKGFTLTQVIADYLRLMGALITNTLQQKYGNHVSMNDVEWCVTLAHDWGDHAMKLMRMSMERAGLVQSATSRGGSPHPLRFVRELEAASYACLLEYCAPRVKVGDKLLVADLGFGPSHITVQKVYSVGRPKFEVKQVAESVLGGQKQFDKNLMELLLAKMPPVQDIVLDVHAFKQIFESHLMDPGGGLWFDIYGSYKTGFKYELPLAAQNRWKQFDVEHGNPIRESYDVIELTIVEIKSALIACVDEIVAVIARQLLSTPHIKAILLIGELCSYNFITKWIKEDLNSPVTVVARGGAAASEGAVAMILDQLPITWEGNDGVGISRTISPLLTCEWSATSPSIKSSNVCGGGEASEPSPENKSRNSRVESVVKKFSWDQVLQMTEGLTSRELGKGGFGTVYLGKFENGKEVAVKVLNQSSLEGKLETFVNEVNLLIQVNHVNLVKLLGYCQDKQNVVIYEYAEEGSIGDHLHGDKNRLNDWKQRLSIMLQAAYGLDYLHSLCSPTIIHRDIKSENILLTKNMVAKVADFGISKLVGADDADMKTYINTKVIGSHWYIDPEYQETGQLRQSSDVYSFGIVLLEIISGRKPCGIGAWVNKLYGSGGGGAIKAIADSSFNGNYNPKAMKVVIKLAISCIDVDGTSRPMMRHVVGELKKAQSIEEEDKKSWIPFWR